MRAEIIRADEVKVGDRIPWRKAVFTVKKIVDQESYLDIIYADDDPAKEVIDYAIPVWRDELIARIDPEPVEEREYWRVKYERYRDTPDGKGYFTSCTDASPTRKIAVERYERRLPNPDTTILMVKDAFIEHIRETVLSREEVKP